MTGRPIARTNLLSIAAVALAAALGLALFAQLVGLRLLSAGAPFWLAPPNDMAINVTGALAVLQSPWRFPPTLSDRIVAPEWISLVDTDSVAWVVLALKALGLGRISPYGLQLLISYILQPAGMALLLRACGVRRPVVLLTGCVLALLYPAWLMRFGHFSLTAHWLLLAALALSVSSARSGLSRSRVAGFAALGLLGPGLHPYFMPPIAIALAAAVAAEILQHRPRAWTRALVALAAFGAAVALSLVILGYGTGLGLSGGDQALGYYSMNLLGPFLPQGSALAGQHWKIGWFDGVLDPSGGQWFEGYNYLGAGILLLMAAGLAVALFRGRAGGRAADWAQRWGPLALGMAVLFAAAIGPSVYLGMHKLAELPRPSGPLAWLAFFRCHGRFFWSVGYLGLALALTELDRHAGPRLLAVLLVLGLALQVLDSREMRRGVHSMFERPAPAYHPPGLADAPQIRGRPWIFVPTFYCAGDAIDRAEIAQLSLIAVRAGGSSNGTGTSRALGKSCAPPADAFAAAAPGDPRITVVLGEASSDPAWAARTDCRKFLRGHICGAGLGEIPGLLPADFVGPIPPAAILAALRFDRPAPELVSGWSRPEPAGVWSDGPGAVLLLPATAGPPGADRLVEVTAMGFALPPNEEQVVGVSSGGRRLATWRVERANWRDYRVTVPAALIRPGEPLRLELSIPGAAAPGGADQRRLGIGLQKLVIAWAAPAPATAATSRPPR
jgi:hypothetical protein